MTTTASTELSERDQRLLLGIAEEAIRADLEGRPARRPTDLPAHLEEPGASFVTLRDGEALLGCIGSMAPYRPLATDVAENARAAAFADPRLPPLRPDQFPTMELKVSVLSPLERLAVHSIEQLRGVVRPGCDGLLLSTRGHRGTFLPSVWDQVGSVEEFLSLLWRKAGLAPFVWPPDLVVERYTTIEFGDAGPRPPIGG